MTNNKNLGKRVKNQNHTCTIHRNTTNSFIPLGSNIQFSTNTVKEQVIIKKTCNNERNVIHVYTVRNLINNLISLSFGSQLRNGCKYKIQYY
jgi:hypothetical protein